MADIELNKNKDLTENQFIDDVKNILSNAKHKIYSTAHFIMVDAYWLIGKRIIEQEQNGKERLLLENICHTYCFWYEFSAMLMPKG